MLEHIYDGDETYDRGLVGTMMLRQPQLKMPLTAFMMLLALPVLIAGLEDRNPSAVLHAARTIELLGKIASSAKPAMEAAIRRKDGAGDQQFFVELSAEAFLRETAN